MVPTKRLLGEQASVEETDLSATRRGLVTKASLAAALAPSSTACSGASDNAVPGALLSSSGAASDPDAVLRFASPARENGHDGTPWMGSGIADLLHVAMTR